MGDRRLTFDDGHAGDWSEWPEAVRIRQMPKRIEIRKPSIPGDQKRPERVPLEVIATKSKGTQAALKAWATRRENERKQKTGETKSVGAARRLKQESGVA